MIRVQSLHLYPLKGGAAQDVDTLHLDDLGALHDRRWMLVTPDGVAITQREVSALALVGARVVNENSLTLSFPGGGELTATTEPSDSSAPVSIFDDTVNVVDAGDIAAEWCSDVLATPCRLVRVAENPARAVRARYGGAQNVEGRQVALTDGAPLLIIGAASLELLNARLIESGAEPVSMRRFRPNIVVAGSSAHDEDTWFDVSIDALRVGVGSTCPRCAVTTVNQEKGKRSGDQPLRELARYRNVNGKAMFGVNATHASPGVIRVGAGVEVLALKPGTPR